MTFTSRFRKYDFTVTFTGKYDHVYLLIYAVIFKYPGIVLSAIVPDACTVPGCVIVVYVSFKWQFC